MTGNTSTTTSAPWEALLAGCVAGLGSRKHVCRQKSIPQEDDVSSPSVFCTEFFLLPRTEELPRIPPFPILPFMRAHHLTRTAKGIAASVLSAIGFGLLPTLNAGGEAAGLDTWDRIAIRFFGTAMILIPVLLLRKQNPKLPKGLWLRMFLLSVFAFGLTSVLLFFGYRHAPTGLVTVLHFNYPLIVMLMCAATGTEKLSPSIVAAAGASILGLTIIIEPWHTGMAPAQGIFLALASAVTFACYVMSLNRPEIKRLDNTVLIFWLSFFSGSVALGYVVVRTIVEGGHPPVDIPSAMLPVLGLIVCSTIGAASLFSIGNRLVGGTPASILSMCEPVTAVLLGWLVLGEQLRTTFLFGAVLVLASATMISVVRIREQDRPRRQSAATRKP